MKYVKKGNVYKKESWLKEHEDILWTCLCVIAFYAVVTVSFILWG